MQEAGLMQRASAGGFTLMEIMVVLVIIGICSAGIGLGLGTLLDPQRRLRQEAFALAQRLQVARDEARLDGRRLRWQADSNGYHFARRDGGRWVVIERDDLLGPRRWQTAPIQVQPAAGIELGGEWFGPAWQLQLGSDGHVLQLRDNGDGKVEVVQ